jgi:hypothetical protein
MGDVREDGIPKTGKVLGILSIIFTSLGLIGALSSFAGIGIWGTMMSWASELGGEFDPGSAFPMGLLRTGITISIVASITTLIANGMGLAGGIGLLNKKPWSIPASNIYAILIIAVSVASYIVSLSLMDNVMSAMQSLAMDEESRMVLSFSENFGMAFGGVFGLFGVVFSSAYPVVLLVLLNRVSVKSAYRTES